MADYLFPAGANIDPNDPYVTPPTPYVDPLSSNAVSAVSSNSNVDSSPYNELIEKANQQHKNYGSTALYIFVNSSSFLSESLYLLYIDKSNLLKKEKQG